MACGGLRHLHCAYKACAFDDGQLACVATNFSAGRYLPAAAVLGYTGSHMTFHRYGCGEIASSYASLEDAFAAGDYLFVSEHAPDGSEILGCAMVLGGFPERGAAMLRSTPALSAFGTVCLAYACWLKRATPEADRLLLSLIRTRPDLAIARQLLDLVRAETINVVMIALTRPIFTTASEHAASARPRYGQFLLRHIGAQINDDDPPYELGDPISAAIAALPEDEKPAFIYSGTPQWFAPPDLASIDIPKVIWVHDTDRFFYRMPDYYRAFDYPTFSVSQEHHEIRLAAGVEGASNLFCDSLGSPAPKPALCDNKEFDLVFTGAAFQTPQTDRARLFSDLAALADRFRILVVDGHLAETDYLDLIGRARFVPIINRYRGCPSPRWRDALARGAFVLYPEGSAYRRFSPGCFPFRPESMTEDIAAHLSRWNDNQPGSPYNYLEQWPQICDALAPMQTSHEDIFEGNLKFSAFLPLLRRHFNRPPARDSAEARPAPRTSWSWPVPPIDAGMFGLNAMIDKVSRLADRLRPTLDSEDAEGANSIAQLNMQLALLLRQHGREDDALLRYAGATTALDLALKRHPDSLLIRWNRAHWRLFFEDDAKAAELAFRDIIDRFDTLRFEPRGSELGFAFSSRSYDPIFWEYEYGNLVLLAATKPAGEDGEVIRRFLLATAFGYLAHIAVRRGDAVEARAHYYSALRRHDGHAFIRALLLQSLLAEIEGDPSATPESALSREFRLVADAARLAHPKSLLDNIGRVLTVAGKVFEPGQLTSYLHHWYRLRRIVGDSLNVRHFPADEPGYALLIQHRADWPQLLSAAVAASIHRREGPGTSSVSDALADRLG